MTLEEVARMNLQGEYERLENSTASSPSKKRIVEFVNDLKVSKNIGIYREYYYLTRLRKLAEMLRGKFLSASTEDLKKTIALLGSSDIIINGKQTGRKYSPRTIFDYKHSMKMFYTWTGKPEIVSWISLSNGKDRKRPEDIITQVEMANIAYSARSSRDRALFYTLYDSGCRIGELIGLKNKDVKFDDYGAILSVFGKTGYRNVRVVGNSVAYLKEWRNAHPLRNDADAWFFCTISKGFRNQQHTKTGEQLTHQDVYKALKLATERAGIKRRIHPHLFRHTRATLLASKVTEAPLELQMGWVHGSRMTQTYVHLSGRDQDIAILKAHGIKVDEEIETDAERPVKCPRCAEPNDKIARFCWKCGMILDRELTESKLKEKASEIEDALLKSQAVDKVEKFHLKRHETMDNDELIEGILERLSESQDLRQRLLAELKK